ncbi:MAG TPA: AgmX/PglI C-terminal domain-containing protein, partial [Polyangiaceae bacterium]
MRTAPVTSFCKFLFFIPAFVGSACGSDGAPAPKTPADGDPQQETRDSRGLQTSSEIGGLDEEDVDAVFKSTLRPLQGCLAKGAERVEFLGGSIAFFLKIGAGGKVVHAHVEKSTLGDRPTEKCMLAALRDREWPEPVGGEVGLARKSFDFDPPNDVRPPTEWDPSEASSAVEKLDSTLSSCKSGASGSYEATVYVATDGSVLAASVTPPDEEGEPAVDCLVEALQ